MAQQSETSSATLTQIQPERKPSKSRSSALDRSHLTSTPGSYTRAWRRSPRQDRDGLAAGRVFILLFSFGAPVVSMLSGYDTQPATCGPSWLAPGEQGHLLERTPTVATS